MTGICGFMYRDGREADEACARMRQALKIYGSYREGQWDGSGISLGIQLFRMLPEDRFDRQPLTGGGGRFALVADVRLDNRPELASDLGWTAEDARNAADADYVLAAWEEWGDGALDRLIGDWAIAVWDKETRTVTLARDMMGARPLFYHAGRDFLAFASMVKGLHALIDIPLAPDLGTLRNCLAGIPIEENRSFYQGISCVRAGGKTVLHADGRVVETVWYDWNRLAAEREVQDDDACVAEFRALFDRAVADRLRATGGIGSQLSGGLDSTAVTVTAAQMLAQQSRRLSAYTQVPAPDLSAAALADRLCNEGPVAAATAARFPNIDHILVDAGDRRIGDGLDAAWYYQETPDLVTEHQAWQEEILRRMARRGETVLLSGILGNCAISWDGFDLLHQTLRRGQLGTWLHEARALCRRGHARVTGVLYQSVRPWLPASLDRLLHRLRGRTPFRMAMISAINPRLFSDRASRRRLRRAQNRLRISRGHRDYALLRLQPGGHSAAVYKGMLAAFGVDFRHPCADRRLVEFSVSLPPRFWLRDGQPKWLYARAFGETVPRDVMTRRQRGFLCADYAERLRRSKPALDEEIARSLNDAAVRELMDVGFLTDFLSSPLPPARDIWQRRYYFKEKTMRALAVAHFLRKTHGGN